MSAYTTRQFWFDLVVDSESNPNICNTTITVAMEVVFYSGQNAEFTQSLTPTCEEPAHIAASAIVRDGDGEVKPGPAVVGDSIAYQIAVTNPNTDRAITVGSLSKSIDPALLPLGWTVSPSEALSPGGPCTFGNGTLTCSAVELAAGQTLTVTLESGPVSESTTACGTFTSAATTSDGISSAPVSVTIECLVSFPVISLGEFTCVSSATIIPMTISAGEHIESVTVHQSLTDLTPTSGSTYEVKTDVPVRLIFREADGASWPDPLPLLASGGTWQLVNDAQEFTFTPVGGDCSPKPELTQTWVDVNGNTIAGEPNVAPGTDFYVRVSIRNTGASTITSLNYESILPPELRPITAQVRPPSETTDGGQRCTTDTAEISTRGTIQTIWNGMRCSLLAPNVLAPGDELSFQVWGRTPASPTTAQCESGISTFATITSVNQMSVPISGAPLTISVNCGDEQDDGDDDQDDGADDDDGVDDGGGDDGSVDPGTPTALRVILDLSDGQSVVGAPWKLYAPMASQAELPIYDQGTVGANNVIQFIKETPPGNYRLVIEPAGMQPIDHTMDIVAEMTEVVLQIDNEAAEETPTVSPTPSPTGTVVSETPIASPTHTATEPAQGNSPGTVVTALPETGTRASFHESQPIIALGVLASLGILAIGIRRSNRTG